MVLKCQKSKEPKRVNYAFKFPFNKKGHLFGSAGQWSKRRRVRSPMERVVSSPILSLDSKLISVYNWAENSSFIWLLPYYKTSSDFPLPVECHQDTMTCCPGLSMIWHKTTFPILVPKCLHITLYFLSLEDPSACMPSTSVIFSRMSVPVHFPGLDLCCPARKIIQIFPTTSRIREGCLPAIYYNIGHYLSL